MSCIPTGKPCYASGEWSKGFTKSLKENENENKEFIMSPSRTVIG